MPDQYPTPSDMSQNTTPSQAGSSLDASTLSRHIRKYLVMGSSLAEMKADALKQGISEKIWNDALAILNAKTKKKPVWRKIFVGLFLVLLGLGITFFGYLYYLFSKTEYFSSLDPSSRMNTFLSAFREDMFGFSKNILLGRLDIVQSLEKKTDSSLTTVPEASPPVQVRIEDVPETTNNTTQIPPLVSGSETPNIQNETPSTPPVISNPSGVKRIKK